jgi:hypothetical protein
MGRMKSLGALVIIVSACLASSLGEGLRSSRGWIC